MGPDRCEVKYWLTSRLLRPFLTLVSLRGSISPSLISERERDCRNSMLFAPVPCSASINKSSAYHFGPVRVRIFWMSAAVA